MLFVISSFSGMSQPLPKVFRLSIFNRLLVLCKHFWRSSQSGFSIIAVSGC